MTQPQPSESPTGSGEPQKGRSKRSSASEGSGAVGPAEMEDGGRTRVYRIRGKRFAVPARYDVVKVIGVGSYGTVAAAYDRGAGESDGGKAEGGQAGGGEPRRVAIKKMAGVFDDLVDGRRVLRELQILRHTAHPNILQVRAVLPPADRAAFDDVYVVTQLFDADLAAIISSGQPLIKQHVRFFVAQLLRGLHYLHSAGVLHRDLKPGNLLVNANCDLVICDFGLSRAIDRGHLTTYVVTRWYRAPELLLLGRQYTGAIDVWAAGCIMAELVLRRPLFRGSDYLQQLHLVMQVLGPPTEADLRDTVGDDARRYLRSMSFPPAPTPMATLFPTMADDASALDFLQRIFRFSPGDRATAAELLGHEYLHKPGRRLRLDCAPGRFHSPIDKISDKELTADLLRSAFLAEFDAYAERGEPAPLPVGASTTVERGGPASAGCAERPASGTRRDGDCERGTPETARCDPSRSAPQRDAEGNAVGDDENIAQGRE